MSAKILFQGVSIFAVIENQKRLLRDQVQRMPASELGDPDLPERLANEFSIEVPILREDEKYATKRETQIDVSSDPTRRAFFGHGPRSMPGTEISIFIPFTGDPQVFNVRPTTFDLNPPIGDVVGTELCFTYGFVGDINLTEHDRTIDKVKRYLDWLRPSAAQLATELTTLAQNLIEQRKRQTENHARAFGSLGIPIRDDKPSKAAAAPASPLPAKAGKRYKAQKGSDAEWDVFICHATEDKDDIARPLANALTARGLSVWYDEFSLKLGSSLRESIDRGLARSQFGVVILSSRFFEKHWPQKELNGLTTREADGSTVVLPVWHNIGFEEVRQYSPMLADRFAVTTSEGLDKVVQKIVEAMS